MRFATSASVAPELAVQFWNIFMNAASSLLTQAANKATSKNVKSFIFKIQLLVNTQDD